MSETEIKEKGDLSGWHFLNDLVRARIMVESLPELWDCYKWIKDSGIFEIIDIKINLANDIQNIILYFDFSGKIIGEFEITLNTVPP